LAFHFLAGQCTLSLMRLLPWDEHAWLLFLPAFFLIRGWNYLAFAAGGAWQFYWMPETGSRLVHPFFWFLATADKDSDPIPLFLEQGLLDLIAAILIEQLKIFFLDWDPEWGAWFLRFGFGWEGEGADAWPQIYEDLGLLHVLVVSGSHFSFIGGLCQRLLEGPGRIAYALRLCSFTSWLGWITSARILLTFLITIFALVVGFHPPCQRAWLSLLLGIWLPLIAAPVSDRRHDRWVFYLQALCFPGSFLSLSNALSWSAYTMVRYLKTWPMAWQRRLLPGVEGPMITVNLSYFGSFSPWGLALNTFLGPVWHIILGWGLLFWIWPQDGIGQGLRILLQVLHDGILDVHEYGQQNGPVRWEGQGPWDLWVRTLLWCAAGWTFFRLWRREWPLAETDLLP
jgi:hypothetical protein